VALYFHSPNTVLWRGAQLKNKHRDNFTFTFTDKYECVSKRFRTESITKYTLNFGITRREATQRVVAAKFTILTHQISIQLHLVAESCTIWSSRCRRPVRKLLDTPSFFELKFQFHVLKGKVAPVLN
jgi:hypothetical protein